MDPAVVLVDTDDAVLLANPAARALGIVRGSRLMVPELLELGAARCAPAAAGAPTSACPATSPAPARGWSACTASGCTAARSRRPDRSPWCCRT